MFGRAVKGGGLAAAIALALAVPTAAQADPVRNGDTLSLTCGGQTYDVVIAGRGAWIPAHDLDSNRIFIPTSFGEANGTVTLVATGEVIDEFTDPPCGRAARPRSAARRSTAPTAAPSSSTTRSSSWTCTSTSSAPSRGSTALREAEVRRIRGSPRTDPASRQALGLAGLAVAFPVMAFIPGLVQEVLTMVLLGLAGGVVAIFAVSYGVAGLRAQRVAHGSPAIAVTAIAISVLPMLGAVLLLPSLGCYVGEGCGGG